MYDFIGNIKKSVTKHSHAKRNGNIRTHIFARIALNSDVTLEWSREIPHDVVFDILLDFNNI